MDNPICRTCNTKHRLGAMYCPALKSGGGGESRPARKPEDRGYGSAAINPRSGTSEDRAREPQARVAPSPPDTKREFKRPLAKDAHKTLSHQQPWKAEGMSRSSWYRRQKDAGK